MVGLAFYRRFRYSGGPGAHPHRPPEPAPQDRGDGRCHERAHNQRVEQQTQADGCTHLPDHTNVTDDHGRHGERKYQPALVTTLPVPPMDRMIPVLSPARISCLTGTPAAGCSQTPRPTAR